jgi:flagellar motor protein MotB
MKTQEKSVMRKSSAIVFVATILIFGTIGIYGQGRVGHMFAFSPSIDTAQWYNSNEKTNIGSKNSGMQLAEKSDEDMDSLYIFYKGFCRHKLQTWLGGGYSSLNYSPTFGNRNYRFGGMLGLGYAFHFNPHWSLGTGTEIGLYNTRMNVDGLTDSYAINDQDGDAIRYYSGIDHYTEKQRLYTMNVPVWLQYQVPFNERRHGFYASLGFKLGIPLSAKYKSNDAIFNTYGYYEKWNQTLYDQRDLGYDENTGKKLKENLNLNLSYMGSAEAGIKWDISNSRVNLYTGVYFDYGFNDLMKVRDTKFLDYNYQNPENFKNNSVLTSEYTYDSRTSNFTNKVSTVALGLKVRFAFNMCANKEAKYSKAYKGNVRKNNREDDYNNTYRKGYRDAYRDLLHMDSISCCNRRNEDDKTFNFFDPLMEAEMRRAIIEYGKLLDLLVLYIDGYEINQSTLSPVMENMLDEKIRLLQKYNNDKYVIICEGHTCDLGREGFNIKLAQMRAETVKEYLVKKGFNYNNIIVTSKGETTPIVPNTNEANRKLNRRVVFLIIEKQ